ncbi:MAG: hypothetical protein H5T43_07695 [Methanomethylovorans sp.]|jgi:hypothetical protein|nr:hypothetical protein [Methanomethylovorans sp.]
MTRNAQKQSLVSTIDLYRFLRDIKFVLLFYVIGDTFTTIYAIDNGLAQEGNPAVSTFVSMHGLFAIVILKVFFILALLGSYIYIIYFSKEKNYTPSFIWNTLRHTIAMMGVIIIFNNLLVMGGFSSPISLILSYSFSLFG